MKKKQDSSIDAAESCAGVLKRSIIRTRPPERVDIPSDVDLKRLVNDLL